MEHAVEKVRLTPQISVNREVIRGYYLITPSGEFFISKTNDFDAFEDTCDQHLKASENFEYFVDYCYGLDSEGRYQWENLDLTGRFI